MAHEIKLIKQVKSFDGWVKQFSHESTVNKCTMQFCVYLPPNSEQMKVPVLYYLAGLTCNEELAMIKSGIQRIAAEKGIAVVCPDTSARGVEIEGHDESYDFGSAAGFYLDATEPNWKEHYNMYSYVTKELPSIVQANFPVIEDKQSIMGHSMGGHGALTLALKNPGMYKSVSAFAPICHPSQCPWGIKAFTGYLGLDQEKWKEYDATFLLRDHGAFEDFSILIDQGMDDQFLQEKQLLPEAFEAVCKEVGQKYILNMREGYDHSYYFISTFMENHMLHHANALTK